MSRLIRVPSMLTSRVQAILHRRAKLNFACTLYIFRPIWVKYSTGAFYDLPPSFVKISATTAEVYSVTSINMRIFYTCSQTWVTFSTRNLHTVQLINCKFRANRHKEGSTFLMGVNGFAYKRAS